MSEALSPENRRIMIDFCFDLAMVEGPDDMFPPDDLGGVREPRQPLLPCGSEPARLALTYACERVEIKQHRRALQRSGALLLREIDLVLA